MCRPLGVTWGPLPTHATTQVTSPRFSSGRFSAGAGDACDAVPSVAKLLRRLPLSIALLGEADRAARGVTACGTASACSCWRSSSLVGGNADRLRAFVSLRKTLAIPRYVGVCITHPTNSVKEFPW